MAGSDKIEIVASRVFIGLTAAGLSVLGLVVAWVGQRAAVVVVVPARPGLVWALLPASNTVTIWLRPGNGPAGRRVLAGTGVGFSSCS